MALQPPSPPRQTIRERHADLQVFVDSVEQAGQTSSSFSVTKSPTVQTNYTIKVEVSDGSLTGTDEQILTVLANQAPLSRSTRAASLGLTASRQSSPPRQTIREPDADLQVVRGLRGAGWPDLIQLLRYQEPQRTDPYEIKVDVSDGLLTGTHTVTLTVLAPNDPRPSPSTKAASHGPTASQPPSPQRQATWMETH